MHRRVAGLRSCRRSRLDWGFYSIGFRLLSAASAVPSPSNNGQLKERPYTRKKGQSLEKKRRPEDDRGIFVDDLSATLDAHRARNRASVIRKIEAPLSQFINRPLLENTRVGEGVVERSRTTADGNDVEDGSRAPNTLRLDRTKHSTATDEDRKTTTDRMEEGVPTKASQRSESESIQRWPADSLQALKGVTKRGRRGYISSSDVLEYTGERKHPKIPWNILRTRPVVLQRPWLLYMEDSGRTYVDRLSNEIKAFEAYMRLTPAEEKASRLVTSVVTSILQSHAPNSSLTLIGSRHTGLATPMSDLDFSISAPSSPKDKGASHDSSPRQLTRTAGRSLRVIEKYLRASAEFTKPDFVHARVPLVTSKHHATGLDIQVQTLAQYQSAQVYTAAYLAELPSLRPLYIVLRHSLEVRNLTTVHEGGLGSYTILMMIVTALKHSSGKFAGDDLGGQLLYILEFYGDADLYKQGFAANPPRVFDKANEPRPIEEREARLLDPQLSGIDHILQRRNVRKPYLLALQDPANIFNDLGKSAYAIKHIQETFKYMREGIIKAVQKQSTKSDTVDKGGTWSCLDYVVKADYKAFETARSKIQRCIDPADHAEMDNSTEAIRQDLLDRALKYKGIKEGDAKATNARQQINPSIAFRRIGQYITFRNHDTTSKSAEEPVKPITLVRAKQKKSKRPAGHLSSKNRVHKTAQIETLAFKSIKLDGNTGMNGSAHGKVPLDIMDEWAPSVAEDEENQGQGFKIRRQKVKPMRTQEEFTSPPDVSEGGKAF